MVLVSISTLLAVGATLSPSQMMAVSKGVAGGMGGGCSGCEGAQSFAIPLGYCQQSDGHREGGSAFSSGYLVFGPLKPTLVESKRLSKATLSFHASTVRGLLGPQKPVNISITQLVNVSDKDGNPNLPTMWNDVTCPNNLPNGGPSTSGPCQLGPQDVLFTDEGDFTVDVTSFAICALGMGYSALVRTSNMPPP